MTVGGWLNRLRQLKDDGSSSKAQSAAGLPPPSPARPRALPDCLQACLPASPFVSMHTQLHVCLAAQSALAHDAGAGLELLKPHSVQLTDMCRTFTLEEMAHATDRFSQRMIVGRGGFGKVCTRV